MNKIIALCVVANYYLESEYFQEYLKHYISIGFNRIYLYDDMHECNIPLTELQLVKTLISSGFIVYIQLYKKPDQYALYRDFYCEHKNEFEWCAFFDSDEYLTLPKHNNIKDFIYDEKLGFESKFDAIHICWRKHTDNGIVFKKDEIKLEEYTETTNANQIETKVIVRGGLENARFFIGHYCVPNSNISRMAFSDGSKYLFATPFHIPDYTFASLEHYYARSTEEYIRRRSVGRLDIPTRSKKQCLIEFKDMYFSDNVRTHEKEMLFDNAISKLND